jgi:hypothetical protein
MARLFVSFLLFLSPKPLAAADLNSTTIQEWNRYLQWANAKVQREESDSNMELGKFNRQIESRIGADHADKTL